MEPKQGPTAGGTEVTITGSGFLPGTSINFGGSTIPAENVTLSITGKSLTFTTPAGTGSVDVQVNTTPTQDAGTFTYLPPKTTSGALLSAETGLPIPKSCVIHASGTDPTANESEPVNADGSWSFESDADRALNVGFYTTADGNCDGEILPNPVPFWYQNQPLIGTQAAALLPPPGAEKMQPGRTGIVACLGATSIPTQTECDSPSTTTTPSTTTPSTTTPSTTQPLAGVGLTITSRTIIDRPRIAAAGNSAPTDPLAHTGQPISSLVSTGCAAVILGAALVRVGAKRRRHAKPQHL